MRYQFPKCAHTLKCAFIMSILLSYTSYAAQIDLLVLYDDAVDEFEQGSPESLIRAYVDATNVFFENSGLDIEFRITDTRNFDENFSNIDASTMLERITASPLVWQWRNEAGADLVVQLSRLLGEENARLCGIAWLAQGGFFDVDNGFSVVRPACGPITMAHEIGHNMGLNHSRAGGEVGGIYEYGLGYGVDGAFATIMTTGGTFMAQSIARFSDPEATCSDLPCGVPITENDSANAVLALNNVKDRIAAYRDTVVSNTGRISIPGSPNTPVINPTDPPNNQPDSGSKSGGQITPFIFGLILLFGWFRTFTYRAP